jgi:hypothetical protein
MEQLKYWAAYDTLFFGRQVCTLVSNRYEDGVIGWIYVIDKILV